VEDRISISGRGTVVDRPYTSVAVINVGDQQIEIVGNPMTKTTLVPGVENGSAKLLESWGKLGDNRWVFFCAVSSVKALSAVRFCVSLIG